MPLRLLKKIILLLVVPAGAVFVVLFATSTGILTQQIPGTDAANNANMTCIYFFTRGFKNEASATSKELCPRTATLEEINAQSH